MNSNDRNGALRAALLVLLLALSGAAGAQQAAGRILVAVGTVTIERGAERLVGATGTEVRKGDTVQVAAQSNAQLRFTDGSVMALRPGTTLRVTEYSYQQAGEKDGTAMDLLKGGLRTVTGLLGRSNRDEYKVNTPTATIGIRGTHYVLRVCDNDCDENTGTAQAGRIYLAAANAPVSDAGPIAQAAPATPVTSRVPNGTYGTVSEGRISVANQSGERQFGTDQVFHVASRASAPQQLIAPPAFLRDRLDGRGKGERRSGASQSPGGSQQQQQQQGDQSQSSSGSQQQQAAAASTSSSSGSSSSGGEAAPTVAQTGQGAGNGDARVSSGSVTPTVSLAITPTLTQVTNQAATAPASILELTGSSSNIVYRLASTSLNIPVSCSGPPCPTITAADFSVQVNPTTQTARIVLAARFADGGQININNGYGDFPVTISGNQLVINGAANSADYPTNQGSFRCSDCGPGDTPGFIARTEYTVTISGGQATLTVKFPGNDNVSFTASFPQVTSTFAYAGAVAGRNIGTNGGAQAYIQLNSAGQPVFVGEPLQIGNNLSAIGSGVNQTLGSDAAAGNLKWGTWTGQATGVNSNYAPFTQSGGSVSPWIVGDLTTTLPASLGTATFMPIGAVIGNGAGVAGALNSASFSADFVNRSMAISINAHNGAGGTYQMNGTAAFSGINGRFAAGWTSVSCTGSCGSGTLQGAFNGFFAGANAQGAGVAFNASNSASIFGAIGFKRQ